MPGSGFQTLRRHPCFWHEFCCTYVRIWQPAAGRQVASPRETTNDGAGEAQNGNCEMLDV